MWGAHAWFTWGIDDVSNNRYGQIILYFLGSGVSYVYKSVNKISLNKSRNTICGFLLLALGFVMMNGLNLTILIRSFLFVYPLWVLFSDIKNSQILLSKVTTWLSYIIGLGLILHLYMVLNGKFLGLPIVHPTNSYYTFFNYFVLLESINSSSNRFTSIFLEPSFCATLIAFLLYTNKYDFKKKANWVLFIGLIFTYSLAGYLLTLLGYIYYLYQRGVKVRYYILAFFLFAGFYHISVTYNDGDNAVNNLIFKRFEYDKEKGIVGNNRFSDATDYYLDQMFSDGTFVFGLGAEEITRINGGQGWEEQSDYVNQIRGAGYKIFLLYYGVFTTVIFLLAYMLLGPLNTVPSSRKYLRGFVILIVVTFLQASYPASYAWLIPFIFACSNEINSYYYN